MKINRWFLLSAVTLSSFLLTFGCSSSATSNWHFTGHIVDLILLETDVPSGWEIERVTKTPIPRGEKGTAIYDAPLDAFGTNSLIRHSIMVFDQPEDATEFLEEDYQWQLELQREIAAARGLPLEDFTPPTQYTYESTVANEFKVLYSPAEAVPAGILVGYYYHVWARYGNVVSYFVTIVADEEQTHVKAGEANVLSWPEVERLLQVIDKRVAETQAAG